MCSIRTDTARRLVFIMLLVVFSSLDFLCSCFIFKFSIECGRCSGSRSSAVLSYSLSFLMSSITQSIDVHPSWRLCSIRAGTPLVCYCAAAFHASSFNHLYFCFLECAIIFCCCGVLSFDLCFFAFFLVSCVSFPFVAVAFFSVNVLLVSFFELGFFNTDVFLLGRVHHNQSCLVFSYPWCGCSSQTWWSWK